MRGFIVLTFAFLGFAFYQMSGGSQYQPVANSFQARSADRVEEPAQVQVALLEAEDTQEDVTRASASLSDLAVTQTNAADEDRFEITLASVEPTVPTVTVSSAKVETVATAIDAAVEEAVSEVLAQPAEDVIQQEVFSLETYAASNTQTFGTPTASGDVRTVTGNSVNMRSGPGTGFQRVGKLSQGMEVLVLEEPGNGWIMLEVVQTGETGWMADWLVTASN